MSSRKRLRIASIGFGALIFTALPSHVAFQDLGALLAHQPGVAARWHKHLIASPFGTIHAAMFSLPRPVGTAIPHPPLYALANFDPNDITASIGAEPLGDATAPLQFPTVNRRDKRDSLLARARAPMPPLPAALPIAPAPDTQADVPSKTDEVARRFEPYSDYEFGTVPDDVPASPDSDASPAGPDKDAARSDSRQEGQVYFGAKPIAPGHGKLTPWAPGEAPVALASRAEGDSDIKQSALGAPSLGENSSGESIAAKGEVTGVDARPKSPAERLALTGKTLAKAEKCLASAVYFEARGESVRGQIAVAQVVMNRVFSPFYPDDVCGVVYQNSNRHLACQFTFACDGIPDVVTEPDAWARAYHIAHDMIGGKLWMPEVAKATHYHAFWVHPDWVNEMKKISKIGVHTFYRPLAWGDGSDEPTWGDAKDTEKEAADDEREWPVSHSREWLRTAEGQAYLREHPRK
ncbi:MAG TPA: cell wall hydrolase [Pseudolabrys sp.]|nr:cell wall hydrolase [Pseudolabrys sp.]